MVVMLYLQKLIFQWMLVLLLIKLNKLNIKLMIYCIGKKMNHICPYTLVKLIKKLLKHHNKVTHTYYYLKYNIKITFIIV